MVLWLALGEQLRAARTGKHLRQREVAAACGTGQSEYSSADHEFTHSRPDTLERIAVYLQLDIGEIRSLAGYDEDMRARRVASREEPTGE
jgi:transcriptional regulator with XRE-family HTH domain